MICFPHEMGYYRSLSLIAGSRIDGHNVYPHLILNQD